MIKFANDHIIIFMIIDETMRILRKMLETCCYDKALFLNGNICKLPHLHMHEY